MEVWRDLLSYFEFVIIVA